MGTSRAKGPAQHWLASSGAASARSGLVDTHALGHDRCACMAPTARHSQHKKRRKEKKKKKKKKTTILGSSRIALPRLTISHGTLIAVLITPHRGRWHRCPPTNALPSCPWWDHSPYMLFVLAAFDRLRMRVIWKAV